MLVAEEAAETGFHAPDGEERACRHAITPLDRSEKLGILLLHGLATGNDRGAATLLHELIERQLEALLAAVGANGRAVVGDTAERLFNGGRLDAVCGSLHLEILHP